MLQIQVSAFWRDIIVLEKTVLGQLESSGGFLRTKTPMPVGTMLIISPVENRDIRVPARVASVFEVVDSGGQPTGMAVEPYFSEDPPSVIGLAPEPAFDNPDEVEPETEQPQRREVDSRRDLPDAPRVQLDLVREPVKDSALMPSVSGEIDLGHHASRTDPDAPDKVIIEVDAESLSHQEPAEPEVAVQADSGDGEESDDDESSAEPDDDKKPKRRRRGRRKKKK